MARWRRRVAVLVVALVAVAGVALPASAQILNCEGDAPPAQSPYEAPGSNFDSGPDAPTVGDPWASPPTSTIYEKYGWAGLLWSTYDTGCIPSATASVGTWFANAIASLYIGLAAFDAALGRIIFTPGEWLAPIDSMFERLAAALREPVVMVLALVVLALALVMAWGANRSEYAQTASRLGRLLAVAVVFAFLYGFPAQAARAFDSSLSWAVDTAQRSFTGTPTESQEFGTGMTANLHESILYTGWLAGTFGNAGSKVAMKYGPRVFDATAYTYAEADLVREDPEAARALAEEKAAEYKAAAAEVKAASPEAYAHLTGSRSWNRVYTALVTGFSLTISVLFSILAKAYLAMGFIAVRLGVMFGFLLVVAAVLRPDKAISFAEGVGKILLSGLWFGIAAGGFAVMQMALLKSNLPAWASALLTLLTAFAFWRLTKALRKDAVPGDIEQAKRWTMNQGVNYASRRWAARSGAVAAAGAYAGAAAQQESDDVDGAESASTAPGPAATPYSLAASLEPIRDEEEPVAALPSAAPVVVPEPNRPAWELEAAPAPPAEVAQPPEVAEVTQPPEVAEAAVEPAGPGPTPDLDVEPVPEPVVAPVLDIDGQSVYRVYVPEEES